MATKVLFHVGLPKTGTTYLQSILWHNKERLRAAGVLLPGRSAREHLWASAVVREDPRVSRRDARAPGAWDRLVAEVNAWEGTAVISHEFFAGASAAQASRAITALGDAEVHVVLTARDTLSLVTARWQEFVKNGSTRTIEGYPPSEETDPQDEWDWGTMDAADVLFRWGATLPPERIHVITMPGPEQPKDVLWRRFADVVGIDPDSCDSAASQVNESLGVVEVELLRRVNGRLTGFRSAFDRGVWIRGYLAQEKLVPRGGERFWPSPERVDELRARGRRTVEALRRGGYHVVGDLDDLLTPEELPARRHPDSVTDGELLDAATSTIADMLHDVRDLKRRLAAAEAAPGGGRPVREGRSRRVRRLRWLRRLRRRSARRAPLVRRVARRLRRIR